MSEQILSQFKDSWVPKTWLTPSITIRLSDWTIVVNWENMTEINGWRYKYDFIDYNKKLTYLIDTDWTATLWDTDRYQNTTNILDAYPNKRDWKWWWGSTINNNVDTKQLAKDVWKTKESEMRSWTVGEHIFKLNTNKVLDAIDNIKIPDNTKEIKDISEKSDNLAEWQKEIQWSVEKQWETIGQSVWNVAKTIDEIKGQSNTQSKEIWSKIDEIWKDVKNLPTVDYDRIEKKIEAEKISLLPLAFEINQLKWSLIDEIKINNYSAMKQFVQNSIDGSFVYENSKQILELKSDFEKSILEIKWNLNELSEKEIDFSPILKEFMEISQKFEQSTKNLSDSDEDTRKQLEDEYKKSMKYIIYIAKNMNNINKNDLQEIKKFLSNISK